jgi:GNAT superfamily N-acetyltransferase
VSEIDRDTAHAIQLRAFRDFLEMMSGGSPGARLFERDGVVGSVVPAVPTRSVANSVSFRDATALAAAHEDLTAAYEEAGVEAWTVWVPDFDREAIELLERARHVYDGHPAAMVLDLAELAPRDLGDLDYGPADSMPLLGELNDRAYGYFDSDGYAPAFAQLPTDPPVRPYLARLDGEPACALVTIEHQPVDGADGPDCGIYWVATPEEYRGRGLSGRLLWAALIEARERGCATSSLQASPMGEPIYAKLGYRSPYRYALYERRG